MVSHKHVYFFDKKLKDTLVCKPLVPPETVGLGDGYQSIYYQSNICSGDRDQINDALESMPSGHSTAAWAGLAYLYFYLNAKLKVFANYHPAMWKMIALYAPLLGAFLISGTLTIDEYHNWYDVVVGGIIGSVMAISAYRMVYASVWDFRFNHIPLTRHTPFSYGAGAPDAGGFHSALWTHKAGWGYEEAIGGAPFDAAHFLRHQLGMTNQTGGHVSSIGGGGLGHHNHGYGNDAALAGGGHGASRGLHGHHNSTAGPHNSSLANKTDPRVDSDLDGRSGLGNTTGTGGYSNLTGHSTAGTAQLQSCKQGRPSRRQRSGRAKWSWQFDRDWVWYISRRHWSQYYSWTTQLKPCQSSRPSSR